MFRLSAGHLALSEDGGERQAPRRLYVNLPLPARQEKRRPKSVYSGYSWNSLPQGLSQSHFSTTGRPRIGYQKWSW